MHSYLNSRWWRDEIDSARRCVYAKLAFILVVEWKTLRAALQKHSPQNWKIDCFAVKCEGEVFNGVAFWHFSSKIVPALHVRR
jgi:hypothetical protein